MKLTTTLYTVLALGASLSAAVPTRTDNSNALIRRNDPVETTLPLLTPRDPGLGSALGKLGKVNNPLKKAYTAFKKKYGKDPVPGSPAAQAQWRAMTGRYDTKTHWWEF